MLRLLLSWLLLSSSGIAQQATFKVDAEYVKVPVTVFDKQGRLLGNLSRDQFRLFDEGSPSTIENFFLDKAPVNVVLLLDVSGSVREELEEIKHAAVRFSKAFSKEDRIAIITFSDRLEVLQDWTNRPKKIKKALKKLEPGYRTALWDALLETAQETLSRVSGRKVIILLTDGLDNESYGNYEQVVDRLVDSDVSLYIVSRTRLVLPKIQKSDRVEFLNRVMKNVLDEDSDFVDIYFRQKETAMIHLAETTGGRVLFPERLGELRTSYSQVARELKSQYVLTFRPPGDSEKPFRNIAVSCSEDVGRIFHRRQYSWQRLNTREPLIQQ